MTTRRGCRLIAVTTLLIVSFAASAATAQLIPVDQVGVFDASDKKVGSLVGIRFPGAQGFALVASEVAGRLVILSVVDNELLGWDLDVQVRFDDETCGNDGGKAYLSKRSLGIPVVAVAGPTQKVFVEAVPHSSEVLVELKSHLSGSSCRTENRTTFVVEAIFLADLAGLFEPPFTVKQDTNGATLQARVEALEDQVQALQQDLEDFAEEAAPCLERCTRRLELKQR